MGIAYLSTTVFSRIGRALRALELTIAWLAKYPFPPLQLLALVLISWSCLGATVGLDDLLWHYDPATLLLNGFACGFFCGELLLVRYLLDRRREKFHFPCSLFSQCDLPTRRLGEFLAAAWPFCLLLIVSGRMLMVRTWQEPLLHLLLPLGFVLSILLVGAFVQLWQGTHLANRLVRRKC